MGSATSRLKRYRRNPGEFRHDKPRDDGLYCIAEEADTIIHEGEAERDELKEFLINAKGRCDDMHCMATMSGDEAPQQCDWCNEIDRLVEGKSHE